MRCCRLLVLFMLVLAGTAAAQTGAGKTPPPMEVGASIDIREMTPEKMTYAKSVGIVSLQVSLNQLVGPDGNLKYADSAIEAIVTRAREAASASGLRIAAFHMPFGQRVDLSLIDEASRQKVVALHRKLLRLCAPLHPDIVLFHPSWYLSVGERDAHIRQLIRSVTALEEPVRRLGATMVIENMTGPTLYVTRKGVRYERPLCRTVPEMMQIMGQLPPEICGAVDMNHILHPEKMVLALGNRLKFIHVSDGDGEHEYHYLPCNGKGMNDWNAIQAALYQVGYTGPFMFECHYQDLKQLPACYRELYDRFVREQGADAGTGS